MKYLPLYKKWMKTGELPQQTGLCQEFGVAYLPDKLFDLMRPEHFEELETAPICGYWGMDGEEETHRNGWEFTSLRQTIVLFLAAMNNEL